MKPRMELGKVEPAAYNAMMELENYVTSTNFDPKLWELIKIRASQINGCAFCLNMHTKEAKKMNEAEHRLFGLDAWKESPFYTDEERAALALTEAITLVTDGHVPDDVYNEASKYFDQQRLAQIIMAIVTINAWNRIAITSRLMPVVDEE